MFVDSLSEALFDDLAIGKENRCGAVCPNLKDISCDFGRKTLQLKKDDIQASWGRFDHNMTGQTVQTHLYRGIMEC